MDSMHVCPGELGPLLSYVLKSIKLANGARDFNRTWSWEDITESYHTDVLPQFWADERIEAVATATSLIEREYYYNDKICTYNIYVHT